MSETKFDTDITIYDTLNHSLADFKLVFRNNVWIDGKMVVMPGTEVHLTVDAVKTLLEQLAIADELLGEDFIVLNSMGRNSVIVDSVHYDSVEDFRNGQPRVK